MNDIDTLMEEHKATKGKRTKALVGILLVSIVIVVVLYAISPRVSAPDRLVLYRIPKSPRDLSEQLEVVMRYKDDNTVYVYIVWCYLYVFLQSFAIPGPVFLSIISGPLFGTWTGILMISLCATTGSSICYLISHTLIKGFIIQYKRDTVVRLSGLVSSYRHKMYLFMIFLRVTPMIPNPLVNVCSPIVGIPLHVFYVGTFIGLIPFNYIHIQTGHTLNSITKFGVSTYHILVLLSLSIVLIIPTLLYNRSSYNDDNSIDDRRTDSKHK